MGEKQTTAEEIAEKFGGDGLRWETYNGLTLLEVITVCRTLRDAQADTTRWFFGDGSSIVTNDSGWDLGIDDSVCHCWAGCGHIDGCEDE